MHPRHRDRRDTWFSRDLPSMERLEMIEPALKTRILARDSTIIKEFYEQNRIYIPIEEIPVVVQRTFLAVEDRRFYVTAASTSSGSS